MENLKKGWGKPVRELWRNFISKFAVENSKVIKGIIKGLNSLVYLEKRGLFNKSPMFITTTIL